MYSLDPNSFMNWLVGIVLATGVLLLGLTIVGTAIRGLKGRAMSYLGMLTCLFICFGVAVGILGFRGQSSENRPWHLLFDMKYQPKYTSQGESAFFGDGRSMRSPPAETIPFDGTDFSADAGFHTNPKNDFLNADAGYYRGLANATAKEPVESVWKDGNRVESYYVNRIPERAIEISGGWDSLFKRGKQQYNVHCAACHGSSGRGGSGSDAHGIVGAYRLSIAPADLTAVALHSQPDGQLFGAIANGKGQMPGYGHQVKVQDRWAIVAYLRVLQYARK